MNEIGVVQERNLKTDNMEMMKVISDHDQSLEDIKNLTSSRVTDQLKVFLVAQARNELKRVVRLTQFLDKLEEGFMNKVSERMSSDSLTLKQYNDVIGTIVSLLSRSNSIISQVLKDDSLMTILNTTIYSSDSTTTRVSSTVQSLKDPRSRERVRTVIQNILFATENYENEGKEVIDANE